MMQEAGSTAHSLKNIIHDNEKAVDDIAHSKRME